VELATTERVCLDIQHRLASEIGQSRFRTWFGEHVEFRVADDVLLLLVDTDFVLRWIQGHYLAQVRGVARELIGDACEVQIELRRPPCDSGDGAAAAPGAAPARRAPSADGGLRGEFDSFVVGPCNELAYVAARRLSERPGEDFSLLVLHGGCGLGKTHLLQSVCNRIRRDLPALEWRYISGEDFTNEFIYAVKAGRVERFRARFRKVDVLVVDDIHFLANKRATQDEFLHTFDAIGAAGKAIVLSSDRHPRSIAMFSDSLQSRLVAGMVVEIQAPSLQTRREVLRRAAGERGRSLPDDVVDYLARHVTRSIRELEGALLKLLGLASLARQPIDLALAQVAVREHVGRAARTRDVSEIIRRVAGNFGVSAEQIRSNNRSRNVTTARAISMFLVRRMTDMSSPEIGRAFGDKTHSTVLMATQRVEAQVARDATINWVMHGSRRSESVRALLERIEGEFTTG